MLGVTMPEADHPVAPLVIWQENVAAFQAFCRVAGHGQWVRNPVNPNQILSLDGAYLINYLNSTVGGDIAELLDEVYLVASGWLAARSE